MNEDGPIYEAFLSPLAKTKAEREVKFDNKEYDPQLTVIDSSQWADICRMYEEAKASLWSVKEVDFSKDMEVFKKLRCKDKEYIEKVIAFIATTGSILNEKLTKRFNQEIRVAAVCNFYRAQLDSEVVHVHASIHLMELFILNKTNKDKFYHSIIMLPCIIKKIIWMANWVQNEKVTLGTQIVASAIVNHIFLTGIFISFWIKYRRVMTNVTDIYDLTFQDKVTTKLILHFCTIVAI
ncbi:ribonucleoside-diphosphate reductase subunit M2-like [Prorops nasuta]|uniref:ribonucleoside-diphosphate reductase subunit M2-like n=1 Tax=Prorops nasuta TaxID=863751 RepID=UPI0034CE6D44